MELQQKNIKIKIGILRAIGASKRDIKRVFRAETIIEGLIAGILGIFIAVIPLGSALFLILLNVTLNVIAGSKPSKMAAKKDPVEALRNE